MNRVLLAEDDPRIASLIKRGLEEHLFQVTHVALGFDAIEQAAQKSYDILILDIILPDIDGFRVSEILRSRKILIPILIVSALNSSHEKVKGLKAGADDYLSKPFAFDELLARIDAQLRRVEFSRGIIDFQMYAGIEINMKEQSASRDGMQLNLSSRELKLLIFLMKNREKAISRIAIAEAVWNMELDMATNTVDVYINYLRNKVDRPFEIPLIHTVKGTGYMLKQKT